MEGSVGLVQNIEIEFICSISVKALRPGIVAVLLEIHGIIVTIKRAFNIPQWGGDSAGYSHHH